MIKKKSQRAEMGTDNETAVALADYLNAYEMTRTDEAVYDGLNALRLAIAGYDQQMAATLFMLADRLSRPGKEKWQKMIWLHYAADTDQQIPDMQPPDYRDLPQE